MHIEHLTLLPASWVPNNPRMPVRIYRGLRAADGSAFDAAAFEHRFDAHGWPADWRGGVYDWHHYHSSAHEVLGVAQGQARLLLGGPEGEHIAVGTGDALLLPVGTGHCCLQASADFQVVGAYPRGQRWDVCRAAPDAATRARMHALPAPERDPVTGDPF